MSNQDITAPKSQIPQPNQLGIWQADEAVNSCFPYVIRNDFLSLAERNFFKILKMVVTEQAIIFSKVNLKDIFGVPDQYSYSFYTHYWNKIRSKHVDFLLCSQTDLKPLCGMELDDSTHQSKKRRERDEFVNKLFSEAGLGLLRYPVKHQYDKSQLAQDIEPYLSNPIVNKDNKEIPLCPHCHIKMVHRQAHKGAHTGEDFYGCPNFPHCREIIGIKPEA